MDIELERRASMLKQQLADLERRYREEAEPIIKKLADIESLRPPNLSLLICRDCKGPGGTHHPACQNNPAYRPGDWS